jgi:hypothetical protein
MQYRFIEPTWNLPLERLFSPWVSMALNLVMSPLVLGEDEVQLLHRLTSARPQHHTIVQRAPAVLASVVSELNTVIAKRMMLTSMRLRK